MNYKNTNCTSGVTIICIILSWNPDYFVSSFAFNALSCGESTMSVNYSKKPNLKYMYVNRNMCVRLEMIHLSSSVHFIMIMNGFKCIYYKVSNKGTLSLHVQRLELQQDYTLPPK